MFIPFPNTAKDFLKRLKRCFSVFWLPAVLALLFAVQNQMFNQWLNIVPQFYLLRRVAVTFALGILLYGPAVMFGKKGKHVYLAAISLALSLIFTAHFLYYRFFGAFLQASALRYAGQTADESGAIKTLLTFKLLLFWLNFLAVAAVSVFSFWRGWAEAVLSKKEKVFAALGILIIGFSGYGFLFAMEKYEWGDTSRLYSKIYDMATLVGKAGIINFSLEDLAKSALRGNRVSGEDFKFVEAWAASRPGNGGAGGQYFGLLKNRNVILIQVESLEEAVIGKEIAGQEITPNLNRLAKEGLYFPNYYDQVGPGNTADAEFSIMNSLYPLPDSVAFIDYAKNKYSALPQLLGENGYCSYVLHGDVPTFWNRSNAYPGLGYSQWIGRDEFSAARQVGFGGLGDGDFFNQAAIKLENFSQPFLATLITLTSHSPFELPEDLRTLNLPQQPGLDLNQQNYLESIRYVDQAIGQFVEKLKQDGLYENSLILIYGDHGSFSGIGQALGDDQNILPAFHNSHVPLVVLAPGSGLKGANNAPASHLDLYPTIANLLGIIPPKSVLGQDILNTKDPAVVLRNLASGSLNTVLTDNLAFEASSDGEFKNGQCLQMPGKLALPVEDCRQLYEQQSAKLRVSDTVIRSDRLDLLLK
ncbi:MAG: LTA synthase family protein [Patescibacteria group bacterium]|nr:LTA synthase family protein [Patescibacteria group bacterium]